MATLLIAEHVNTALKDATNKALTAARALGGEVHVLVAGKDCRPAAEAAAKLDGVAKVLLADAPLYEHMVAEPVAALIVSLAGGYDAILAPATTTGKNVAGVLYDEIEKRVRPAPARRRSAARAERT